MSFEERLVWFLVGAALGFVLGYITRTLREIKEELDEVDTIVKHKRDETGITRHPLVMDAALFFVVAITVWAAFASQKATNQYQETQEKVNLITYCNEEYLNKTIRALNERTTYAQDQATANVNLQRAQARFLSVLLEKPPLPQLDRETALKRYFRSLSEFIVVNGKAEFKAERYPYPTNAELSNCIESKD